MNCIPNGMLIKTYSMTSNKGVFDISVILVPYTKIFTCHSVLLCVGMYAYIRTSMFWEKNPNNVYKLLLVFYLLKVDVSFILKRRLSKASKHNITSFP